MDSGIKLLTAMIFISGLLITSGLIADQHSDENRLLKSWGFQFNTQGELVFDAENKKVPPYQPWIPDMSAYLILQPQKNAHKILQPLVISPKNKSEE